MGGKFIILKAKLCRKSGERIFPLKLMLSNAFHTLFQLAQWTDADFAARRHKGSVAKAIKRCILSKQFLKKTQISESQLKYFAFICSNFSTFTASLCIIYSRALFEISAKR